MGKFLVFLLFLAALPIANAVCIIPKENMEIKENALFCYGTYSIEKGISIISDNIIVDCNNSVLIGNGVGYGILLNEKKNVVVQNCNVSNYEIGIYLDNANNTVIRSNYLTKNKFGIALFNSFNNDVNDNILLENIDNTINYLPTALIQEKELVEVEKRGFNNPQEIISEVIRVKKPFLKQDEVIDEVNVILSKYLNMTQQNLEITRSVSYNMIDESTSIILHLKPKKVLLNVSIYEKIPKCVSSYVNQILFETGGYEVIKDDPLVLWTFSRLENEKEITYKVLRNIDDECKNLLLAFGIAAGFEEFGKKEERKNINYVLVFSIIVVVLLVFVIFLKTKKKLSS